MPHLPVPTVDSHQTEDDTVLVVAAPWVLGKDRDVDGQPLSAILVSPAANGTVT